MCSLKPLDFCAHHNFKNIQKRPINSSRGKMRGKIIILIPKVFLRPLNSFEIIFRQKNINCTAVEAPGAEVQDKCLFIHFYQSNFLPMVDVNAFYVFVSKPQNEQEICCLFIGSWHRGNCHKNYKF